MVKVRAPLLASLAMLLAARLGADRCEARASGSAAIGEEQDSKIDLTSSPVTAATAKSEIAAAGASVPSATAAETAKPVASIATPAAATAAPFAAVAAQSALVPAAALLALGGRNQEHMALEQPACQQELNNVNAGNRGSKTEAELKTAQAELKRCLGSLPESELEFAKEVAAKATYFQDLPEYFRNNVDVAMSAVTKSGMSLEYATEEVKNNPTVVIAAVKKNGESLQYATEEVRNNPTVVIEAVKRNGYALAYASDEVKKDTEVVMAAIKSIGGSALGYASDELKENPDVVMAAVKSDYNALNYASEKLKNNSKFMQEVVTKTGDINALEYASAELKDNPEFIKAVVTTHGPRASDFASERVKKDRDVVEAARKSYG